MALKGRIRRRAAIDLSSAIGASRPTKPSRPDDGLPPGTGPAEWVPSVRFSPLGGAALGLRFRRIEAAIDIRQQRGDDRGAGEGHRQSDHLQDKPHDPGQADAELAENVVDDAEWQVA